MKKTMTAAIALTIFLSAQTAFALTTDQVVTDLQAQGYTRVEVRVGPSQIKVEAIRGNEKLEVIYDSATGAILKSEVETVGLFENTTPGVSIREDDDDFVDQDDDEDDDDDNSGSDDDDEDDDDDNSGSDDDDEDDDDDHSGSDDDDDDDDDNSGSDDDDDDDDDNSGSGNDDDGDDDNSGSGNDDHGDDD